MNPRKRAKMSASVSVHLVVTVMKEVKLSIASHKEDSDCVKRYLKRSNLSVADDFKNKSPCSMYQIQGTSTEFMSVDNDGTVMMGGIAAG